VVSKGPIYLSGNNVTVDSFISSDPRYSTNGMYTAALARDHGDVITNSKDGLTANNKPLYALDIGDADIKGHVSTDQTAPRTSLRVVLLVTTPG